MQTHMNYVISALFKWKPNKRFLPDSKMYFLENKHKNVSFSSNLFPNHMNRNIYFNLSTRQQQLSPHREKVAGSTPLPWSSVWSLHILLVHLLPATLVSSHKIKMCMLASLWVRVNGCFVSVCPSCPEWTTQSLMKTGTGCFVNQTGQRRND